MTSEQRNPKVDDYIAASETFARPVLAHLRDLIHRHCPEVAEAIKWGIPHFSYAGEIMCMLAAHSSHCSFTFWKEAIMTDPRLRANPGVPAVKRYMGKITSLGDLPDDTQLAAYLKEAMDLNEKGAKLPPREAKARQDIEIPERFAERLASKPAAQAVFESKSASFRKEYLTWIADAKTEGTRDKRIDEALAWIAEGKSRFWKYQKQR